MFAVHIEIRNRDGSVSGDFALESQAGLLHPRSHKVGRECRHVVGHALRESGGKIARSCGRERAVNQRVGISGKDLMVVIVGSVKKKLSVGHAVLRGDGGVVDLRNADVEQSITRANHQRMSLADGIGESRSRSEIVRIERDLAGGRE